MQARHDHIEPRGADMYAPPPLRGRLIRRASEGPSEHAQHSVRPNEGAAVGNSPPLCPEPGGSTVGLRGHTGARASVQLPVCETGGSRSPCRLTAAAARRRTPRAELGAPAKPPAVLQRVDIGPCVDGRRDEPSRLDPIRPTTPVRQLQERHTPMKVFGKPAAPQLRGFAGELRLQDILYAALLDPAASTRVDDCRFSRSKRPPLSRNPLEPRRSSGSSFSLARCSSWNFSVFLGAFFL